MLFLSMLYNFRPLQNLFAEKMPAQVFSAHKMLNIRTANKAVSTPSPVVPGLGFRCQQRLQQIGALSMHMGDSEPTVNPLSFLQAQLQAERKQASTTPPRSASQEQEQDQEYQRSVGKPRFRSALEQVSYLTNESAMNRK